MSDAQIYSRSSCDIENIPDEILAEILAFLSSCDLKSAMQASSIFANIVSSSSVLMKKFFMVITTKRRWDFETLSTLRRKHQSLVFFDFINAENSLDESLMKGLKNVGVNLKRIEFNNCNMCSNDFIGILKNCEDIKSLKIIHSKINGNSNEFLNFNNLKSLKVSKSEIDYEMFKNVQNLIKIHIEVNETQNIDLKNVQFILSQQTKLKSLTLVNLRLSNLFDVRMKYLFQLESMKIIQCHFKHKENFEIFLDSQYLLKEIEFSFSNMKLGNDRVRYYDSIVESMLKKIKLRKFSLNIEDYKFCNFSFMLASPIQELTLRMKNTNFTTIQFLKYFPHLKTLELDVKELNDGNIELLNKSSLLHLKIISLASESFAKIKIKSLKSLHIHEMSISECDWKTFIENNSDLTKFVINFSLISDFDVNLLDILTKKLKSLEHIELIDKYLGFDNEIYEMIVENCKKLKYIKLWNINIEKDFEEKDKEYLRQRGIKFNLFNDESLNRPMIPF